MRGILVLVCVLLVPHAAGVAAVGPTARPAPAPPPPDPAVIRQGGDTILDAVPLTIPVYDLVGTTAGYTDDYDETCPYSGSISPDVVYVIVPSVDLSADIDMCGSAYDTKIYVYDDSLTLVACNDDFYFDDACGQYVSRITDAPLYEGLTYYLVIDGYGGDFGTYLLNIWGWPLPCELPCDEDTEGEPPLVQGYQDAYNGGCDSVDLGAPMQSYHAGWFCGQSGGYVDPDGVWRRDTDWYVIDVGPEPLVEILMDAEWPLDVRQMAPRDCDLVETVARFDVGVCSEGLVAMVAEPWSTLWLRVALAGGGGPDEFEYTMFRAEWTATEARSWSTIKSMFR